ncbi:MAG: carboxypeptidase-like regulatory domain-containing protein, partial [Thermoanaerobaculia bacterium]
MASTTRVLVVVLLVALLPQVLFAQARLTAADLQGTVLDQSGGVLPGVTIVATNAATNQSRNAVTDKDGRYYIGALPPGMYTISAELAGFAPQKRSDFRLVIGQLAELNFSLKPGTAEAITVSATAPVVDTK